MELIACDLLPRASLITRLLLQLGDADLSRAETQILSGLQQDGPQRITTLAAAQALAQPTVTQLVTLMEGRGLVERRREPQDGRAVLVSLTDAGAVALEAVRTSYRGLLRELLAGRSDEDVRALAAATDVLQDVIDALQEGQDR